MSATQIRRVCQRSLVLLLLVVNASSQSETPTAPSGSWRFAVSGDSRNCGDVVMPAIAQKVISDKADFFWHLGDYRAIYTFDEDFHSLNQDINIIDYEKKAWGDFIESQLKAFGDLPVYLALGNHENLSPKSQTLDLLQFSDWFAAPGIVKQRLSDDQSDRGLRAYYHWFHRGVDFITMDNSTPDEFDDPQMAWFTQQLGRDLINPEVKSIVVGMHEALPDSLAAGHSMNDSAQGARSGRLVYQQLVEFQKKKHVYVLASHAHFFMDNVYNTKCRRESKETILPGWIVGTGGAAWYELPEDVGGSNHQLAHVYGYLLATVAADSAIQFEFMPVSEQDAGAVTPRYSPGLVHQCFTNNSGHYTPKGPTCGCTEK